MRYDDKEGVAELERPIETSAELRWDRIREARAKIRRGDYDFDLDRQDGPAGVCLVSMLRDVLDIA